jgi:hypothetical protein
VQELFRADAKAEGDDVILGGWRCYDGEPAEAAWYSLRLTRKNAKWAFAHGEPFRQIAALELLATLLSVVLLCPADGVAGEGGLVLGGSTDNRGNSFAVSRLLTTKYPLSAVLMQLADVCATRGLALHLWWVPRGQNTEADDLSNEIFRNFDPARRVDADLSKLDLPVLHELLDYGEGLFEGLAEKPTRGRPTAARNSARGRLAALDPW